MASSAEAKDLWPIGWHKQSRAENERRTTGVHTLIKKCALVAATDVSLCSFAAVAPTTSTLCSWLSGGEIDADRRTQPPPPPPLLPKCPLIKLISSPSLSSSTAAAAAVRERIIDTAAAATVIDSLIANFTVVGSHHPRTAAASPLIVLFAVQRAKFPQIKHKLGLKIKVQR